MFCQLQGMLQHEKSMSDTQILEKHMVMQLKEAFLSSLLFERMPLEGPTTGQKLGRNHGKNEKTVNYGDKFKHSLCNWMEIHIFESRLNVAHTDIKNGMLFSLAEHP